MPRRLALAATLLTTLALAAWWFVARMAEAHLDIEQAELQARIAPHFPTRHCALVVMCLELSNPVVVLTEGDDRVGFTADVKVSTGKRDALGRVGF